MPRHVALVCEACGQRYFRHRMPVAHQQSLREIHAALDYVLMHRRSHGYSEEGIQMRSTYSRNCRNLLQRKIPSKLILDEGQHLFEPAATETLLLFF